MSNIWQVLAVCITLPLCDLLYMKNHPTSAPCITPHIRYTNHYVISYVMEYML